MTSRVGVERGTILDDVPEDGVGRCSRPGRWRAGVGKRSFPQELIRTQARFGILHHAGFRGDQIGEATARALAANDQRHAGTRRPLAPAPGADRPVERDDAVRLIGDAAVQRAVVIVLVVEQQGRRRFFAQIEPSDRQIDPAVMLAGR